MDVLSEVLGAVRLTRAAFFALDAPATRALAAEVGADRAPELHGAERAIRAVLGSKGERPGAAKQR
jgi:hypothetical protein